MKTLKSLLSITFAVLAFSSAANAGRGGEEITSKAQFSELKTGDKVILVCKMCKTETDITIKDSKSAMELCEDGHVINCPKCKKDFKVTWINSSVKGGAPTPSMSVVDEDGKSCMVYMKAS